MSAKISRARDPSASYLHGFIELATWRRVIRRGTWEVVVSEVGTKNENRCT